VGNCGAWLGSPMESVLVSRLGSREAWGLGGDFGSSNHFSRSKDSVVASGWARDCR
jgi:hypothetical protein